MSSWKSIVYFHGYQSGSKSTMENNIKKNAEKNSNTLIEMHKFG